MLRRFFRFCTTILIGGIGVIFPLVTLIFVFKWLYDVLSRAVRPLAMELNGLLGVPVNTASILSILVILASCFIIGLIIKTKTGTFVHNLLEKHFFSRLPGYRLLREAARSFFTIEQNPIFTRPALIRPYDSTTRMTAFITDHHKPSGTYTAFVPTSPNPTSGMILHVSEDRVQFLNSTFEETMRTVVTGGNGSHNIFSKIRQSPPEE